MSRYKTIKSVLMTVGLMLYGSQSLAVLPIVYDPYDVLQNTITAKNSVQALLNQAKQLQFEVENLKRLPPGQFENTNAILNQLTAITSKGKSLSYGNNQVDEAFIHTFPGPSISTDYPHDFSNWSRVTYDTLKNSMLALSLQGKLFDSEDQAMNALQTASENVQGNVSAQQTTHRIALQEISQLQKLRQLMLNQASTQNTFMAYQLQKEQSQQASWHEWIQNSQMTFHPYNDERGFGVNELPTLP
jgi:type IV secretion system protein TrbJ